MLLNPLAPTPAEDGNSTAQELYLAVGSPVVWTYLVTNTGNSGLNSIKISDTSGSFSPVYVSGDTNANGVLDPGETWLYTSQGVSSYHVVAGQYLSSATVTATDVHLGTSVTANDPSDHFGVVNQISVDKAVNAVDPWHPTVYEDANSAPGPVLITGSTVTWTYLVTNQGNTPVDLAGLQDDAGNGQSGPRLQRRHVRSAGTPTRTVCSIRARRGSSRPPGSSGPGEYTNTATASGQVLGEPVPASVTATDVAHLYGTAPGIHVVEARQRSGRASRPARRSSWPPGPTSPSPTSSPTTTATSLGGITLVDDNGTPGNTTDDLHADLRLG